MTDHLIEIIFKDIRLEKIGLLLKSLISEENNIISYNLTYDCHNIDWRSLKSIENVFCRNEDFGLFINLKKLTRDKICLPNCGIAIYKNENKADLEINFQLSDLNILKTKNPTKELMKLSKSIADQYQIDHYFCGLEPAQEIETRLFTNEHPGPFFF